jgi:release factor glutamine methyltransferase
VTVLEVIQRSTDFLTKKGVDSPRLQAELLSAHVLKLPRMQLYLNFERALSAAEQDSLRELIKRRGEREPLQHIIGSTSFCGLEIAVDRRVLIPRPETELLAEQGWIFLNQRLGPRTAGSGAVTAELNKAQPTPTALDFGTGSGCLAIALAAKCPSAQITAMDIELGALELARKNASQHGVAAQIEFVLGDGLFALQRPVEFDLIAANPPYVPTSEIADLQPEVRDHDPRRALDGGVDGLDFYRHLAEEAGSLLKTGGKMMLEIGDGQNEPVAALFQGENWIVERVVNDYTQCPRILIIQTKL